MEFDERVLKHAPWSISKANLLGLCPRQYVFKYVEKRTEGKKSTAARIGVAAHSLLEAALKDTMGHDELLLVAAELAEKNVLTSQEEAQIVAHVPGVLDYVARVAQFKEAYGVRQELIEEKLAVDRELNGCSFFDNTRAILRGVLDHGLWTGEDTLVLIDHKSGRKKPINEHATQFYAYMVLAIGCFPTLRGVQCGINYFGEPRCDWFPRFNGDDGEWTRQEIEQHARPWLQRYLNATSKRLAVIDQGVSTPETGWQCEYCGYVDACPEGQLKVDDRKAQRASGPASRRNNL